MGCEQGGPSEEGAERPVQEVPCPAPFAAPNLPTGALSALVQGLGALVGVEGVHHGNTAR